MKVEGISNYYAFMYNRNTGKITPDNETDDGFADFYNPGNKDVINNLEYNTGKARFDSLTRFFGTPGEEEDFFNPVQDSGKCAIIEEKVSVVETRYYIDGKLMFTSLAGEFTADIKFAPDTVPGTANGESLEFKDVSRISISDIDEEEEGHVSPKRKTGTTSQVVVSPDGTRWLVTTMYFCGHEIKIVKKLPPIDPEDEEEDSLLRQDDNEEDKPGIADASKIGINRSLEDVLKSYLEDEDGFDRYSLLFEDYDKDKK